MPLPDQYANAAIVTRSVDRLEIVSVLWYLPLEEFSPGDQQATAQALADGLMELFAGPYKAFMATDANIVGARVNLNDHGITFSASSVAGAGAGTVTSDSLPDYAAALIRKRTGHGGKTGRGRVYVGPVAETMTDNGRLTGPGQAGLLAIADKMTTDIIAEGTTFSAFHLSRKDTAFYPLTQAIPQTILATQRRRRLRPSIV